MPLIVGITGGIGSGKTLISRIFSELNVPTFNADNVAKEAYKEKQIINQIAERWPNTIDGNGMVSLRQISSIAFQDSKEMKWLESLIHPFVHQRWNDFVMKYNEASYIIRESAILIQTQLHLNCDYVILVEAPNPLRILRVAQRSQLSTDEIIQRMETQMSQEEMSKFSHFTIHNHEPHSVIEQVLSIHQEIIKRSF